MTVPSPSRSLATLAALTGCAAALTLGLSGCQSEQEQRIAEARELLKQRQPLDAASGKPAAVAAPTAPTPGAAAADDLAMPVYPGSKPVTMGSGNSAGLGDGLSMSLLETQDSVDAVIAFYAEKLKPSGGPLQATRTEDKLDGRRVVRLSVPRDGGGLQTVEARDAGGKTTVQLMNMKGQQGAAIPTRIPGLPAVGGSPSATQGGATKYLPPNNTAAGAPRDLTAPPPRR